MTIKELLKFIDYFDKDITIYDRDYHPIFFRECYSNKLEDSEFLSFSVRKIIKINPFEIYIQTYESAAEEVILPYA